MLSLEATFAPKHTNTEQERTALQTTMESEIQSFDQFFNRFYTKLLVIALKELEDLQDAEDVVQTTFFEAARDFEKFRGEGKLSSWIYSIHWHNILDVIRSRRRKRENHKRFLQHKADADLQEPSSLNGTSGDIVTNNLLNGELTEEVITSLAYRTSPETLLIRLQTIDKILRKIGDLDNQQVQKLFELYLEGAITHKELQHRLQTAKTLNEHPEIRDRIRAALKEATA